MGKVIKKKIQGMSWIMKTSLVLLLTLTSMVFMYEGWYKPKQAAALSTVTAWARSATGTAGPYSVTNASFSCGAGTNRLLVAVVTAEAGTAAAANVTATKGTGINFTTAVSTSTARGQVWIGYLTESQITGNTNAISITNASGQAWTGSDVYLTCYDGVSQTQPLVTSGTWSAANDTAAATSNLSIPVVNGGVVVYGNYNNNAGPNSVTESAVLPVTPAWTTPFDVAGTGYASMVGEKLITAVTTPVTTTFNWTSQRFANAAISLNPASAGNLTITNGTNPASTTATQASTSNAMNGFSTFMSAGTGSLATMTLTGSTNFTSANVTGIRVYHDLGTAGVYDAGIDTLVPTTYVHTGTNPVITFTGGEPQDTTTQNYIIVVDVSATATVSNTLSATVSAVTGTVGTPTISDSSSGVLTVAAGAGLTVTNGTNPANANAARSSTNNALDAFTMVTTSGAATINTLTLTGGGNFSTTNVTNPNGVKIYQDNGTLGVLDGADTLIPTTSSITGAVATITFTTPEAINTTLQNYLVVVDIPVGATLANTLTGTITAATGSGYIGTSFTDSGSATLTITAAQTLTVGNGTNPINANIGAGSAASLDSFTLAVNTGSATISTLTLTGSPNFTTTNIQSAAVYADNGVVGTYEAGTDVLIPSTYSQVSGVVGTITFTTPEPVTTTAKNYLIRVTAKSGATLAQAFTGTVTAATGTGIGTPTYSDTASATLTITTGVVANITNCGGCHGFPGGTNALTDGTRGTGLFPGSHNSHVNTYTYTCDKCHRNPSANDHANGRINMANPINGTGIAKYNNITSFNVTNAAPVFGTCNSTNCHGQVSPQWGKTPTTNGTCTKCHGVINAAFATISSSNIAPGGTGIGTNGLTTGNRVGTHQAHLLATKGISRKILCSACHTNVVNSTATVAAHLNRTTASVSLSVLADGSKAKTPRSASLTRVSGQITCTNTYCHAGYTAIGAQTPNPAFNSTFLAASMTVADCTRCHGLPPLTSGSHTGKVAVTAFPIAPTQTCSCHSTLNTAGTTYANIFTDSTRHIDGILDGAAGGHAYPYPGGSPQHKIDAGTTWATCSCHTTTGTGTITDYNTWRTGGHLTATAPNCSVCHIGGLANAKCSQCHGAAANDGTASAGKPGVVGSNVFPNISGSHSVHMAKIAGVTCSNCHSGFGTGAIKHGFANTTTTTKAKIAKVGTDGRLNFVGLTTTPTWVPATNSCNNTCHGSGAVWGGRLGCIDCHNSVQTTSAATQLLDATVVSRPIITNDFSLTSSHTRSRASKVATDDDCIVCHMEGNATTHAKDTTGIHGNGYVELRDPDTGTTILSVNHSAAGVNTSAGAYADNGAIVAKFVRFKRNLAITLEGETATTISGAGINNFQVIGGIMKNHCLKCHDTNGALSTAARTPAAIAAFGANAAWKPFNATIAANSRTGDSGLSGGVLDVSAQFAGTNRSFHPVLVKQNNSYASGTKMYTPWNGVVKPGSTGGTATTTVYGPLISCWDCHAVSGATGAITTTGAHGANVVSPNAVQLRGQVYVQSTTNAGNLCKICHVATSSFPHGSGSALADTSSLMDSGMSYFADQCYFCHGGQSTTSGTEPARPIGAGDAHGFSTKQNNTAFAAVNSGYGFVRSNVIYATYTNTTRSVAGTTYATATCGGASCRSSMDGVVILPGGVY